jgi:hypothetical protein
MPEPSGSGAQLPQTLGWYRESANWLVGLAAAALATAATFVEKFFAANLFLKLLFTLGGISLFVAVFCGLAFYFWLLSLGNSLESTGADRDTRISGARTWYPRFYYGLLAGFLLGAFFLATLAIASLYSPPPGSNVSHSVSGSLAHTSAPPTNFKIIPIDAKFLQNLFLPPTDPNRNVVYAIAMLLDRNSGTVYYCQLSTSGVALVATTPPSCNKTPMSIAGATAYDSEAATAMVVPESNSSQQQRNWTPSPFWIVDPSNIATLRLCLANQLHPPCSPPAFFP